MSTFTYKSKYGTYTDCMFMTGYYENGNLGVEIWSNSEGPITKVTVNPDVKIPTDKIAVKDYSENEGMVAWLKSMDIIKENPTNEIRSGWIKIPVYELTDHGKEMLSMED